MGQIVHLKHLHQKNSLEHLVDVWVNDNIEKLDERITKRSKSEKMGSREEYLMRERSINIFVTEAERLIRSKTLRARRKQIREMKDLQSPTVGYEQRLKHIEDNISRHVRYIGGADATDKNLA